VPTGRLQHLLWRGDALIGQHRRVECRGDAGQGRFLAARHRLLDEGRREGLDIAQLADGIVGRQALVVVDPQVKPIEVAAKRFQAAEILGVIEVAGLHLQDAMAGGEHRLRTREIGGEIGVGDRERQRDRRPHPPAEQRVHWRIGALAGDIPQRDLDGGLGIRVAGQRRRAILHARDDSRRIGAEKGRNEHMTQGGKRGLGRVAERCPRGRLPPAGEPLAGGHAQDDAANGVLQVAGAMAAGASDLRLDEPQVDGGDAVQCRHDDGPWRLLQHHAAPRRVPHGRGWTGAERWHRLARAQGWGPRAATVPAGMNDDQSPRRPQRRRA